MNEFERKELDELKSRQAALQEQLTRLGFRVEAFERRLSVPQPAIAPEPPKHEPIVTATPQPVVPLPQPPALPPRFQPPPIPKPAPVAPAPAPILAQSKETEPAPEPVLAQTVAAALPPPEPAPAPLRSSSTSPAPKKGSLEMRVGTYWLVRIGIVMLLTSLVFFGNYAYQNFIPKLGAGGKVGLLYLASGALLGIGTWLQRKQETLKNYAQVLQAGGLAAVYFTTYAAHHFPTLEIIHSAVVDGALLLGWAGFITWLADRKKSEVLALFAVLLAYYTSVITHAGQFTLYSNLVLTIAAVFFLVRNRWATLTFVSLAATYISYAFWRFFDAGQWHWANPSDGLWTGNYFLMGYWLLFTAAVFLSRHEFFNRERRASFLSLNNGAFFSSFLLTMLQVHQDGFWKFSLAYGALLLALSLLAYWTFPKDRLAGNAYLTQGLLLVTLGFLTHLTGFALALVLAVESVMLLVMGQMLKNRVLQAGSIITALLAAGWAVATMKSFDPHSLIAAVSIGALMLFNAFYLRPRTTYETSITHPRTIFYTIIGLALWTVATWQNAKPEWRGLVMAGETVLLLLIARPLGNQVLRYGAGAFAGMALYWETVALSDQFTSVPLGQRTGLIQAVALGALTLFSGLWEQRTAPRKEKPEFRPGVIFFTAIGMFTWLLATGTFTPHEYLTPMLSVEALLLTAAFYLLRLRELPLFGQVFLVLAQALWIFEALDHHAPEPWWNPATVIAVTLVLASWWQRQKSLQLPNFVSILLQGIYAMAIVGLLFFWLQPQFSPSIWFAFAALLAIVLTAFAALNRYWSLAAAGQIFIIVSGWGFCVQMWDSQPAWYMALVPMAALCTLSFSAVKWFQLRPGATPEVRDPILGLGRIYRIFALAMSLWWVHKYIPARENMWVLTTIGLILFLVAGWRRNLETLLFGAAFTLFGLLKFWLPFNDTPMIYWPNLFAILCVLVQQQIAQRKREHYQLPREVHAGIIIVGSVSLWMLVSHWVMLQTTGFYLTVAWSVLSLVLFIGGMMTRERVYRWVGLTVLACALGRVVIFDVWKLETIYRIFTFMALGLVLLILGFIYNKYQEKIKEWL